jgi:hypothetical protein
VTGVTYWIVYSVAAVIWITMVAILIVIVIKGKT